MSDKEIKVPNIGEFKEVEVIEVLVSDGQSLSKNDPLITIESDKSSVEIPSSVNGKIKSVKIKVGDKVSQGDLILTLEESIEEEKNIEKETIKDELINGKEYYVGDISEEDASKNRSTAIYFWKNWNENVFFSPWTGEYYAYNYAVPLPR